MNSKANQDPFHSDGKPPSALGGEESRHEHQSLLLNGNDKYHGKSKNGWDNFMNTTTTTAAAALPNLGFCIKASLSVTVALYILNQKHLLPRPLSAFVSKSLFWPTIPITVVRRLGKWETVIDDTVVMGGAPFGFAKLPEKLYTKYGVRILFPCAPRHRHVGLSVWAPRLDFDVDCVVCSFLTNTC